MKIRRFNAAMLSFALASSAVVATPWTASAATTFMVDSDADAPDAALDGTCADADGNCTLRAAVAEAGFTAGDDTIVFAHPMRIRLDDELYLRDGGRLTIQGLGMGLTILDGQSVAYDPSLRTWAVADKTAAHRVLDIIALDLDIEGLTITGGGDFTNGPHAGGGGARLGAQATLDLTRVEFVGNASGNDADLGGGRSDTDGGALEIMQGTTTITDSRFIGNTTDGDGAAIHSNNALSITRTVFEGNGKVVAESTDASPLQQDFHPDSGGAIWAINTLDITDSRFVDNQARYGGAVQSANGNVATIIGTEFTGNRVSLRGGAIESTTATLNVVDSTFTGNIARGINAGGAFGYGGAIHSFATTTISSSIFDGNDAWLDGGAVMQVGANVLHVEDSSIVNNNSTGQGGALTIDNRRLDTGNGDHRAFIETTSVIGNTGGGVWVGTSTTDQPVLLDHVTVAFNTRAHGAKQLSNNGYSGLPGVQVTNSIVDYDDATGGSFSQCSNVYFNGGNVAPESVACNKAQAQGINHFDNTGGILNRTMGTTAVEVGGGHLGLLPRPFQRARGFAAGTSCNTPGETDARGMTRMRVISGSHAGVYDHIVPDPGTATGIPYTGECSAGALEGGFEVDSTIDAGDGTPGDGSCVGPGDRCTLRAAIEEINGLGVASSVELPGGVHNLGAELDVTAPHVLIVRNNRLSTPSAGADIQQTAGGQRVFDVGVASHLEVVRANVLRTIGLAPVNGNGGLVRLNDDGGYTHRDGDLSHGASTGGGGGAIVGSSRTVIVLDDVVVHENSSPIGAGIWMPLYGGSLTVRDSQFVSNNAASAGGAIELGGHAADIANTTFVNNTAGGPQATGTGTARGGAISMILGASLRSVGNAFDVNTSGSGVRDGLGGALWASGTPSSPIVIDFEPASFRAGPTLGFGDNAATTNGGAIAVEGTATLRVSGQSFATHGAGLAGGALHLSGNVKAQLRNSDFFTNTAPEGGAILVEAGSDQSELLVGGTTFVSNDASGAGGGAIALGGGINQRLAVLDSTFTQNTSSGLGGAIRASGIDPQPQVVLRDSDFVANEAANAGGALEAKGLVDIRGGLFESNVVQNFAGGGAMHLRSNTRIEGSTFRTNHSDNASGGALSLGSFAVAELLDNTFEGNTADAGGALHAFGTGALLVDNNNFVDNEAFGHGGAVHLSRIEGGTTITGSDFLRNVSTGTSSQGGAIHLASVDGETVIDKSMFRENGAHQASNIVVFAGPGNFTLRRSSVAGGVSATGGAAVSVTGSFNGLATIENSTITGNSGGVVHASGTMHVEHSTLADNTGGVYANLGSAGGSATIANSIVGPNDRTGDCFGATMTITGPMVVGSPDAACQGELNTAGFPWFDLAGAGLGAEVVGGHFEPPTMAVNVYAPPCAVADDAIGTARPRSGGCDLGAIESLLTPLNAVINGVTVLLDSTEVGAGASAIPTTETAIKALATAIAEVRGRLSATNFGALPFQTSPFQTSPFQTSPFQTSSIQGLPFQTSPFQTSPFQTSPFQTSPFQTSPFEGVPAARKALAGILLSQVPITGSWKALLASTNSPLAGLPEVSVTLLQVFDEATTNAALSAALAEFDLGDIDLRNTSLFGTPAGALVFSNSTILDVPLIPGGTDAENVAAWCDALAPHVQCGTDLGINPSQPETAQRVSMLAVALAAAPFQTSPFQTSPFQTSPLGGLEVALIEANPFQTSPFQTSPFQTSPFEQAPFMNVPFQTSTLADVPFAWAPFQTSPIGELPWAEMQAAGVGLSAIPFQTSPFQTSPFQTSVVQSAIMASIDLASIPFQTSPFQTSPFQTSPFQTSPFQTSPFQTSGDLGALSIGELEHHGLLAQVVDCSRLGGCADKTLTLREVAQANAFAQGANLGTLQSILGPVRVEDMTWFLDAPGNEALRDEVLAVHQDPTLTFGNLEAWGNVTLAEFVTWVQGSADYEETLFTELLLALVKSGVEVTLGDVILALLGPDNFAWEAIDPNEFALDDPSGGRVSMDVQITASDLGAGVGEIVFAATSDFIPIAASVATGGANLKAGNPVRGENGTWAIPLTGLANGTSVVSITAAAPLSLGGSELHATVSADGSAPVDAGAVVTVIDVNEPNDTPADVANAPALQDSVIYLTHINNASDIDLAPIDLVAGQRISIVASNLGADVDMVLYAPPIPDQSGNQIDSIEDDGLLNGRVEPQQLQDIPLLADRPVFEISASRGTQDERIDTLTVARSGRYLLQLNGYNGESADAPVALRVKTIDGAPLAPCQPVDFPAEHLAQWSQGTDYLSSLTNPVGLPADYVGVNTLFLVNQKRLVQAFGAAAADEILGKVQTVAGAGAATTWSDVRGAVVPVDRLPGVEALFDQWGQAPFRCDPDHANLIVGAIRTAVTAAVEGNPGITDVVIVGDDAQIPAFRQFDLVTLSNERTHATEFFGQNNELVGALANGRYLVDDAIVDLDPLRTADRQVFVPDLALGRLIESPQQIGDQLDQYMIAQGVLAADTVDSAFVAGYDFLADGSEEIADNLQAAGYTFGQGDRLINDSWGRAELLNQWLDTPIAIASINAHFDDHRLLTAAGDSTEVEVTEDQILTTAQLPSTIDLEGVVIYSAGCHSGLNVSGFQVQGRPASWNETLAGDNLAHYSANSGFGYGDTQSVALSERLLADFSTYLDGSLTVGEAMMFAKQGYVGSLLVNGVYDEKIVQEMRSYGLPFYRFTSVEPPAPQAPGARALQPQANGLATSPFAFDVASDTAAGDFTEVATLPGPVFGDRYWSVDGETQGTHFRAIQPRTTIDVTAGDGNGGLAAVAGFALIESAEHRAIAGVDPAILRPIVDLASKEPAPGTMTGVFPSALQALTTTRTPGGLVQKVVLVPGQFRGEEGADLGTQRLFDKVSGRVFYRPAGVEPGGRPTILRSDAKIFSGNIAFNVAVTDPEDDVELVHILYTHDGIAGQWQSLELGRASTGGWSNSVNAPNATKVEYFVTAVDATAVGAISSNKGFNYQAINAPIPPEEPEPGAVTVTPVGQPSQDGWYAGAGSFEIIGDGSAPEYRINGGPWTGYTARVTITETGSHQVDVRSAGQEPVSTVIRVDADAPTISVASPIEGAFIAFGEHLTVVADAVDAGIGLASVTTTFLAPSGSSDTFAGFPETFTPSEPGHWTMTVVAEDRLGQSSSVVVGFIVGALRATGDPLQVGSTFQLDLVGATSADVVEVNWDPIGEPDNYVTETVTTIADGLRVTHVYASPGLYRVRVRLNGDTGTEQEYRYVVVYDPNGGHVTGSGSFESPPGALRGTLQTATVKFGFKSKYTGERLYPTGKFEFELKVGDEKFDFTSEKDQEWLVVDGNRAAFQGTGEIKGRAGEFAFQVIAVDGNLDLVGLTQDQVRLRVFEVLEDGSEGEIVYDNALGVAIDLDGGSHLTKGKIKIKEGDSTKKADD